MAKNSDNKAMTILGILGSLKITITTLIFGFILVFVSTLAQIEMGIFRVKDEYFNQWFVMSDITMFERNYPVFLPGGFLIGAVLLINLLSAYHIKILNPVIQFVQMIQPILQAEENKFAVFGFIL